MPFEAVPAIVGGIIGGVLMILARILLRVRGLPLQMDVVMMWGTMLKLEGGAAYGIGWIIHLVVSVAIGLVYAWGFAVLGVDPGSAWLWGIGFGLVHWLIAGAMLAIIPAVHPGIPARQPSPGPFAANLGVDSAAAFFVGHLLYALAFTLVYLLM